VQKELALTQPALTFGPHKINLTFLGEIFQTQTMNG